MIYEKEAPQVTKQQGEHSMKQLQNLLALCVFTVGFGMAGSSFAADSPAAEVKLPERDKVCTACHNESWPTPVLSIYQTKMGVQGDPRTPGCTTCHGPSQGHIKDQGTKPDVVFKKGAYEASDDKVRAGQCYSCHKGKARSHWEGSQHANNQVACNDCHQVHAPQDRVLSKKTQAEVCFACHKEQRADSLKISTHPIAVGKIACSDCHNPHGSVGPTLLKKNTVVETCHVCHADKRGPFLFEHQPVVENCTYCHAPHGSNLAPMLNSRSPFLCQSCHDGPHASETPAGRNAAGNQGGFTGANPSANVTGRGCLNCHSQIHGSNSPTGGYLQR
jgi:DmsE family decaheme c-type cytochrome